MVITFRKLWEDMEKDALISDDDKEDKSLEVVRSGINLRGEEFWEDFITLCYDSDSMSELLDVSKEKISKWPSLIEKALEEIRNIDGQPSKISKRNKMVSTGEELSDPNGIEAVNNEPAETRPMP